MAFSTLQSQSNIEFENVYSPTGTDAAEWVREQELMGQSVSLPVGEIIDYSDDYLLAGFVGEPQPESSAERD